MVPKTDVLLLQMETAVIMAKPVARKLVGRILCKYGCKNSVLGHFWSQTCYRRACGAHFLQVWHYLGDSRCVAFRVICSSIVWGGVSRRADANEMVCTIVSWPSVSRKRRSDGTCLRDSGLCLRPNETRMPCE